MKRSPVQRTIDAFLERLDEHVAMSCDRVRASGNAFYLAMPLEMMRASVKRVFQAVGADLAAGEATACPALLGALGAQRADMGASMPDILDGMYLAFELVSEELAVRFAGDPEARFYWEQMRGEIAYKAAASLAASYFAAREKVVRSQADEILRLSTQVLPLYRGILVLPLIGRIDAERAGTMTAALLEAVVRHGSRVVVLDVSGVPVVDAAAAGHLVRAASALELVGARPLLVGVGPDVARAMVASSVHLGRLTTLADLESGLCHALGLLGKAITDVGRRAEPGGGGGRR
ncbi:MAG: STAS domain-containing protein [Polyangiaceae bacterium]|nr:STAS domain-containing protein [Polyangiaceae bacterium]